MSAVGSAVGPLADAHRADAVVDTHRADAATALWAPDIRASALEIFEKLEDDPGHTHPGVKHIYLADDAIRFDMHLPDRDSNPRKQRNEAAGMRQNGETVRMLPGQTWKLAWDLFIPASLRATKTFTHIHQLRMPGAGSLPIFVMSLHVKQGKAVVNTRVKHKGIDVGETPLEPLQDHWIRTELEYGISDNGYVRWTLTDNKTTVIDVMKSGLDLFMADRVRPKWGIYRVVPDPAELSGDCYLLIRDLSGAVLGQPG